MAKKENKNAKNIKTETTSSKLKETSSIPKTVSESEGLSESEDFDVIYASQPDENTVVLTSKEIAEKWLQAAMERYDPSNQMYSTYLKEGTSSASALTLDNIDTLADGAQSNLSNILAINSIVRKYINMDSLIGRVASAIEDNVNSEYRLSYNDFSNKRNKTKKLRDVKLLINNFNRQIDIENFIRKAVSTTYFEGNFIVYLRNKNNNWIIDYLPLGVAEISDYEANGRPVVQVNMKELESRIRKTYIKTRSGKGLFFDNVEAEIRENYCDEIYQAFKARENYAKLVVERTGVVRTGNLGRKYGLTPIFKALKSIIMLEQFDSTNLITSKSKAKKIIVQKLRKELLGTDGTRRAFEEQSFAHDNLMQAWQQPTVVVTTPVFVESIEYVEPKTETTNVDLINLYQNRVLTSLGIGFLASDKSVGASVANINLAQLMLTINKISKQVERVLEDFYRVVLKTDNIDMEFLPSIKILDSEQMDYELRQSLASLLFTTLNCSHETALGILGINVEDEVQKRIAENEAGFDEIFSPRATSYTTSNNDVGRKPDSNSKDPDKQLEDKLNKKNSK